MSPDKYIVFKGSKSMTGKASEEKFPGQSFENGADFDGILSSVANGSALAPLPIWNSHVGEVRNAEILNAIMEEQMVVHSIWPFWVDVACIGRAEGPALDKVNSIAVFKEVISFQCSKFLEDYDLADKIISAGSTVDSYNKFSSDHDIDAALCDKDIRNDPTHIVLKDKASNDLNFTTFVLLCKSESSDWSDDKWRVLKGAVEPKSCGITCVEMPSLEEGLTDDHKKLFEQWTEDCSDINTIPKITFVASREDTSKIILLLEYEYRSSGVQGFSSGGIDTEVRSVNNAGSIRSLYADEVQSFLPERYSDIMNPHFIKHEGTKSCFFACPPLKIMIHGYESEKVESIALLLLKIHFDARIKGFSCTDAQETFFDKHIEDYKSRGNAIFEFEPCQVN